jgi:hypothetical protein
MSHIEPGLKTSVKFKSGLFVMIEVYRNMLEQYKHHQYADGTTFKFLETYYHETRHSDPQQGRYYWIWWRGIRTEEGSSYYWKCLDVEFHGRFIKDVEIMNEGKKIKVQKGEIEILLNGYLKADPKDEWKNHWFLKHVDDLFWNRIWRKRRKDRKASVRSDTYKVQHFLKEFFSLATFTPGTKNFYTSEGGYKDWLQRVK